jgi:hypothetical protein
MIHFKLVRYLADRGYIRSGARIMDVGTQNLLFVEEDSAVEFVRQLRRAPLNEQEFKQIQRVCYFSTPRPGERTTFLHELLALTDVVYESIDIVDGLKTTIFDLNFDTAPRHWLKAFDLVINCGTLEHVIHQHRALTFIHDVLKVKGIWFDQPPSIGFLNHGYFNYNPLFYMDLAAANRYELVQAWYSHAGGYPITDIRFPIIDIDHLDEESERAKAETKPFAESAVRSPEQGTSYNFNAVMKKTVDAPLRLPLEIRTTHGPVGAGARTNYGASIFDSTSKK